MFWYGNFFWIFIMVIVVAGIVSRIVRDGQRERTIRAAIEKGAVLDPAMLSSLNASVQRSPQDARAGLLTGAIVTLFVGIGLAVMGYVLDLNGDGQALRGLAGVGAFLACISLGLFVARLAIRRTP